MADAAFRKEGIHLHTVMVAIMGRVSPNRVGLSVAAVVAGWHVVWSLLIAFGGAQRVLEFAYKLHSMKAEAVVGPFNFATAALLVLVTAILGYVSGAVAAITWNCLQCLCPCGAICSPTTVQSAQSPPSHGA